MIYRLLLLFILTIVVSGCGGLGLGHSTFKCEGDGEGGRCGSPADVYTQRKAIMKEWEDKPAFPETFRESEKAATNLDIPAGMNDIVVIRKESDFSMTKQVAAEDIKSPFVPSEEKPAFEEARKIKMSQPSPAGAENLKNTFNDPGRIEKTLLPQDSLKGVGPVEVKKGAPDFTETEKVTGTIKSRRRQSDVPVPVRRGERAQSIYFYPYEDSHGNMVEGYWTYIIAERGAWLLPDGRTVDLR